MTYLYRTENKDCVRGFALENLKQLGLKVPKLDKIKKAGRNSISQVSQTRIQNPIELTFTE